MCAMRTRSTDACYPLNGQRLESVFWSSPKVPMSITTGISEQFMSPFLFQLKAGHGWQVEPKLDPLRLWRDKHFINQLKEPIGSEAVHVAHVVPTTNSQVNSDLCSLSFSSFKLSKLHSNLTSPPLSDSPTHEPRPGEQLKPCNPEKQNLSSPRTSFLAVVGERCRSTLPCPPSARFSAPRGSQRHLALPSPTPFASSRARTNLQGSGITRARRRPASSPYRTSQKSPYVVAPI